LTILTEKDSNCHVKSAKPKELELAFNAVKGSARLLFTLNAPGGIGYIWR
jgi:hypothetical protein